MKLMYFWSATGYSGSIVIAVYENMAICRTTDVEKI